MSFTSTLDAELSELGRAAGQSSQWLDRFLAETRFAADLAARTPAHQVEWENLISQAAAHVKNALISGESAKRAVPIAEGMLAPMSEAAKQYAIHCVGHGHIDMNWMWNWPETVATTNDTFTTVDRLMDEFPGFHYSQSQTSVYQILKDYLPELYARVKQRVAEGRWEVTANFWTETDKNMPSGEILCRHILYTKRFFQKEFGIPYGAVAIDWEPDTFGHAHTIPTILNKAGIRRYYLHRAGPGPMLFWWQGPDGSRVLVFDDRFRGYNGRIDATITRYLFDFEQATGLKDFLFVFGVGDHGGGPTRRDLRNAADMAQWPIFPQIKLSTTDAFFSAAEQKAGDLPVVDAEMNYVFEGCYTAQSNIKRANRKSENALVEAESAALLAKGLAGMPYPAEAIFTGWRHAMFNQFHDILPGSGVHATYEHAQGLFQEVLALTGMAKTRALRMIAGRVNTASVGQAAGLPPSGQASGLSYTDNDIGGGPGDIGALGEMSRRGAGGAACDPFLVFNPSPWPRTEVVAARLWDRTWPGDQIAVTDESGAVLPAQVVDRGNYWGHTYVEVAFPARDVGGLGYRTYAVGKGQAAESPAAACTCDGKGRLENEFLSVEVEPGSGAIIHLVDKRTGVDLVPAGGRIGVLEYLLEAPHPMTAWVMGQIVKQVAFEAGGRMDCPHNGPYLASVRTQHRMNDSTFALTVSLAAGVPRVDFSLDVNWLERGSPEIGVPMLKAAFPLAVVEAAATFECPNGCVTRSTDPRDLASYTRELGGMYWKASEPVDKVPGESPLQKWVDLTGQQEGAPGPVGAAILNDTKYGCDVRGSVVRLTLLRSSYDPDPLPELGQHTIRFAIQPHVGDWTPSHATLAGNAFNFPFNVVGTDIHEGNLPLSQANADILTGNVMLSGLKKAEDSDGLIVRLYEMEGRETTAQVRLAPALCASGAAAAETDLMEQPLAANTAAMSGDVLSVNVPAHGLVTVRVG